MIREVEEFDNAGAVRAGNMPAAVLGEGTLLDDFVLTASRAAEPGGAAVARAAEPDAREEELPEDPEEWDFDSVVDSEDSAPTVSARCAPGIPVHRSRRASVGTAMAACTICLRYSTVQSPAW